MFPHTSLGVAIPPRPMGFAASMPTAAVRGIMDSVKLGMGGMKVGLYSRGAPDRIASLNDAELAVLEGEVPTPSQGRVRRGLAGMRRMAANSSPNMITVAGPYARHWNTWVTFCDLEQYDPWAFCVTTMEMFAGYMFEKGTVASLDNTISAINYILTVHGCHQLYRGGRITSLKAEYRDTMKQDRNSRGLLTYRALIPDHGMTGFFARIRAAEAEGDDTSCIRAALILVKMLTWVRAVSLGASQAGDITFVHGFLTVIIRRTKCGGEAFEPTQFSIPWPKAENTVALFVMTFLQRTLRRHPDLGAGLARITPENAADCITAWMRAFMPAEELNLPAGSYIASHSSRDTGASHSRCSLVPPCSWDGVMSWGGWRNQLRCLGYAKQDTRFSAFWGQFYWWLSPLQPTVTGAPRQGYFELGVATA